MIKLRTMKVVPSSILSRSPKSIEHVPVKKIPALKTLKKTKKTIDFHYNESRSESKGIDKS